MVKTFSVIVLIVAVVSVGSLMVRRSVILTAASGQPLDHLGPRIRCRLCDAQVAVCSIGYKYKCDTCGKEFRARWNAEQNDVEMDW